MTRRFCDVCNEEIHGKRDRIFAKLVSSGRQIFIAAIYDPDSCNPTGTSERIVADVCMKCIAKLANEGAANV